MNVCGSVAWPYTKDQSIKYLLNLHGWKLAENVIKHCLQASPYRRDKLRILDWAYYPLLYNNVTSLCIFIGCWPWSMKAQHTHRWLQIHVRSRQRICFPFFMPQNSSINLLILYKTNRLHFSVDVYCNRSLKTENWRVTEILQLYIHLT